MVFVSCFLIRRKPNTTDRDIDELASRALSHDSDFLANAEPVNEAPEYPSVKQAIKTCQTWHLISMILCSSCYGLFIASVFKVYGNSDPDVDFGDSFITLTGAIASVLNGTSRLFWSSL
jgi:MFS family permease